MANKRPVAARTIKPYEAFLHIVHVSDAHYRHPSVYPDADIEWYVRQAIDALRRAKPKLADEYWELWLQGNASHDPFAHELFCDFLRFFAAEPEFAGIETWLLDTGDLSAKGDQASIDTALARLEVYRRILGSKTEKLFLYGNHDAWPGKFIWFGTKRRWRRIAMQFGLGHSRHIGLWNRRSLKKCRVRGLGYSSGLSIVLSMTASRMYALMAESQKTHSGRKRPNDPINWRFSRMPR